jgi:hypothetical protein
MAVVQISRIQVRRGQKNIGSGIPQLASGEIGWAVDTREMYIGNGSVAEGSPSVGNTKILTEFDNLFSVANTYIYKGESGVVATGGVGGTDIQRTLQDRLDDRVSGKSFGLTGQSTQNATVKLQTAIDQLFLNAALSGPSGRVTLHLEAGEYVIDDTITLPPYASIVGDGYDKTVIRTNTAITMLKTVNGSSTIGSPASRESTTTLNQPTNIKISGVTFESTVAGSNGIELDCCKDSIFDNVRVKGPWANADAISTDKALIVNNLAQGSTVVASQNNKFTNCKFDGYSYAVVSDWDSLCNTWSGCEFSSLGYGIAFGTNLVALNPDQFSSQNYGPFNNIIEKSKFYNVNKQAIWVKFGEWNRSVSNRFDLCGSDGGADYQATTSVIKFETNTNTSERDVFARTNVLGFTPGYWTSFDYQPEIEGAVNSTLGDMHTVTITYTGIDGDGDPIYSKKFRLPAETDIANQTFEIDYIITSSQYGSHRSGTLSIVLDGITKTVLVDDDYNFNGASADLYLDKIYFDATIQTFNGEPSVVDVLVSSQMPSDDSSQMEFRVKHKKTNIDAIGE